MKKSYAAPPAMSIDVKKQYIATMKTQHGDLFWSYSPRMLRKQ